MGLPAQRFEIIQTLVQKVGLTECRPLKTKDISPKIAVSRPGPSGPRRDPEMNDLQTIVKPF
jgi:hypothetical protein